MTSKNLHSTSKLTEFSPISPDEEPSSVGGFIAKFFRGGKSEIKDKGVPGPSVGDSRFLNQERNDESHTSQMKLPNVEPSSLPESQFDLNVAEGRSLPNVLKRLSSLVALKNVNPQAYGDADLKQYWMPDAVSRECYDCGDRFTTFRRRHHCRICGQIFCSRCCSQGVPGKILGCTGDLRVCTYCCRVVHSYLQSAESKGDFSADVLLSSVPISHTIDQENDRLGATCPPNSYTSSLRRKHSVGYQEERFGLGRDQPVSKILPEEDRSWFLYALCQQLSQPDKGLPMQTVRVRLRVHHNVFAGTQLVDWLVENGKAADRMEASFLGEVLVEGKFLECVSDEGFSDTCALYRVIRGNDEPLNQSGSYDRGDNSTAGQEGQEPSWVKEVPHRPYDSNATTDSESDCLMSELDQGSIRSSPSAYQLDLDLKQSTVHLRPSENFSPTSPPSPATGEWGQQPSAQATSPSSELLSYALMHSSQRIQDKNPVPWHQISQLSSDKGDFQAYTALNEKYGQHEQVLLNQLLNAEGLPQSWAEIAMPLVHEITSIVHPDYTNDAEETDIRHYVQFKKVIGGGRSECKIVNGITFTKNVAHRAMVTRLENPKILLLDCAIAYQRVEGRFHSLEPVMMQEQNYLKNVVARIEALQPDLIFVTRNVSHLAQESLRLFGITLALNVKISVLERISRCIQAPIITSVDALIGRPQMGTCKKFYLRTFKTEQGCSKTLMFLEGCPLPQFGCSVLLRGGNQSELSRLKRVLRHMIFCRYHWRLELSYLMDEFAQPPNTARDSFFEEPNMSPSESALSQEHTSAKKSNVDLESASIGGRLANRGNQDENSHDSIILRGQSASEQPHAKLSHKSSGDQILIPKSRRRNSSDQPDAMKRVTAESISDFSDPLHQYLTLGEEASNVQPNNAQCLAVAEIPCLNQFRKALDDTILSISPYLKFTVPFLETDQGRSCTLRQYLPSEVYWSHQFHENESSRSRGCTGIGSEALSFLGDSSASLKIAPKHPFMDMKLTCSATSPDLQEVLAHFRACGGRISPNHSIISNLGHHALPQSSTVTDEMVKDVLDPENHQHLSVLFCSFSTFSQNAPAFCVNPWVVNMDFYGRNDISLGSFLERYCFRTEFRCPSKTCSTSMLQHVRRFVHYPGCVQVTLQLVEGVGSLPNNDHILMWSCCSLCSVVSPVTPMSPDTWALSFGKYLELRFHGDLYNLREEDVDRADQASFPCSHSLHHDFYQYFGYHNIVASFKYSPIFVWEVSLPPESVKLDWETQHLTLVFDEINEIAVAGQQVFSQVLERIFDINSEDPGLKAQLQKDQAIFKSKVDDALISNSPVSGHWKWLWHLEDTVVDLIKLIIEAVTNWNTRLKTLEERSRTSKGSGSVLHDAVDEAVVHGSAHENILNYLETHHSLDQDSGVSHTISGTSSDYLVQTNTGKLKKNQAIGSLLSDMVTQGNNTSDLTPNRQSSVVESEGESVADQSESSPIQSTHSKSVKTIFSQFLPSVPLLSTILVPAKLQEIHIIMPRSSASIPVAVRESQPSTIIAHALASNDYQRSLDDKMRNPSGDAATIGASLAPKKSHGFLEKERDNEKDRDSLNGEFLQSSELRRGGVLSFLRGSPNAAKDPGSIEGVAYTTGISGISNTSPEVPSATNIGSPTSASAQHNPYIEVQFKDSSTHFFCRIYYAEEFLQLRRLIWPRGEEAYVRSLAHCVQWAARGGKSGSTFCKTRDDRLVLKEMSRTELSHFLEQAPQFFAFMTDNHKNHRPTLLGKILGVYRIVFKNDLTGVASRSNLLVMENLFYGREVSHKFDLKGSIRNRLVNPCSEPRGEVVLLDENLLKITRDSPLYVLPHAKSVLSKAIKRDTEFLTSQSIMDYSLLVGLDESRKELVVGIIDYMRSFTWDKRLETVLKKVAGQGKAPTIVHPEEYQNRFIAAMHCYFLTAPDRWYGFGKGFE